MAGTELTGRAIDGKRFAYGRAAVDIGGVPALGFGHIDPRKVQRMDSSEGIELMREVGQAIAWRKVRAETCARLPAAA